ncbi:Flagellar biosynthesis/type III secretory pathway protein-like protein [Candidatus Sulfopaludibacter sp. SbA3]|nr:Flagellar biosynthesis/type III secretory pathway protein-like protein [Candidatus Sulfopaludibacter sp. SbA3]
MSSKVFLPDDPANAGPVVWKKVSTAGNLREGQEASPPDAEELRAQLRQECDRKVREAQATSFREGEAAGKSRAAAEVQPVIERLVRSIDEMAHLRARFRREAEGDMVRLSLAIARRVLRRELAIDPDAMHGLVLGALEKLQSQEICRVRVHPSQAAPVTACLRKAVISSTIEVIPDPAREPGAVVFETDRGNLDASVDSQLQEIERGLIDRLQKQS